VLRPRRQIKYCRSASGLATLQPRKPKAAHHVNWFYLTSSFSMLSPFAGDCIVCSGERHLKMSFLTDYTMHLKLEDVNGGGRDGRDAEFGRRDNRVSERQA